MHGDAGDVAMMKILDGVDALRIDPSCSRRNDDNQRRSFEPAVALQFLKREARSFIDGFRGIQADIDPNGIKRLCVEEIADLRTGGSGSDKRAPLPSQILPVEDSIPGRQVLRDPPERVEPSSIMASSSRKDVSTMRKTTLNKTPCATDQKSATARMPPTTLDARRGTTRFSQREKSRNVCLKRRASTNDHQKNTERDGRKLDWFNAFDRPKPHEAPHGVLPFGGLPQENAQRFRCTE